ncbi:MAG: YggT family protein [Chloroflexi bacterium]|nr:YggT family protein [Chloroflexota bacterium]
MARSLFALINLLFTIYSFAIIARAFLPLLGVSYYHPVMRFLIEITEPLLGPLRRVIPPIGGLDFSPMVALIIIWVVEQVIRMMLLTLL